MARTYVVSDIHGCYGEFLELLRKIDFRDEDELFVLGDVLDRGKEPIPLIRDIMDRPNVFMIKGNHDIMALGVLRALGVEVSDKNIDNLKSENIAAFLEWMSNGGETTVEQFRALPSEVREDILCYLEEAEDYEVLNVGGKCYILVHGGLKNFSSDKELYEYSTDELVWERPDYTKRYFEDERVVLVTGHTPTSLIRDDEKPLVYQANGHLAIDCGCVFGGNLAAVCLDTGEVTYVESK